MMIGTLLRRAVVLLAICGSAASAEEREDFKVWLRENREKFPMVDLKRDQIPFAKIHTMPAGRSTLEHKGRYFTGYRFTTPEWLDGDIFWMFGMPGDINAKAIFAWYIVPEDPEGAAIHLHMRRQASNHYPRFRELFPGCGSMLQQPVMLESLKPSSRYIVWFSYPTPETMELKYALTVNTKRGREECGILPSGYPDIGPNEAFRKSPEPKAIPPKELVADAVKVFREAGIAPALEKLDRGMRQNIDAGASFQDFWVAVWYEAQTGSGRTERAWAAELYLWLQQRCLEFDATNLAVQVGGNGSGAAMTAYRYGSARTILIPFYAQMERRKLSMDPRSYPDAGPAFPSLPDVRMRKFPMAGNQAASYVTPNGIIGTRRGLPDSFNGCMENLAEMELMGGDWRTAIERNLWVRDWAERMGEKIKEPSAVWYGSQIAIARALFDLGLLELADGEFQKVLESDLKDIYNDRTRLSSRASRIEIRLALGQAEPSMLAELDEIFETTKKNVLVNSRSWEAVEIIKAKCLVKLGREAEGEAILKRMADEGSHAARVSRLYAQVRAGKTEGIEHELLAILQLNREWGKKVAEADLYSLYADFLTRTDRLPEALAMRREAVKLMRAFDLFIPLPKELAKLSVLLSKCGDEPGSTAAADEAERLSRNQDRIPPRIQAEITATLKTRATTAPAKVPAALATDLQPLQASMVPIKDMPLRGRLTLSNPSAQAVEGTLAFDGIPVDATWNHTSGEVKVEMGKSGIDRLGKLRVEPGSFVVIDLSAAPGALGAGRLSVVWSAPAQKDQESVWTIGDSEAGVASAIVDAGVFKRNAFYGVPIHHHFQSSSAKLATAPLRAVCSQPARVELYDGEGRPVYVDAIGNGSFNESGDVVYQDADGDGSPEVPLKTGESRILLQVYPAGEIPAEGLKITLESLFEGRWLPFAEDRIQP